MVRRKPVVAHGEELGLENVAILPDQVRDTAELRNPGRGFGRDPQRTPMPWNDGPGCGFTTGQPWLPVGPENARRNVAAQTIDPRSFLNFYRLLIGLRRREPALVTGDYLPQAEHGSVLAYTRRDDRRRFFVALNLGGEDQSLSLPGRGTIALNTFLDRDGEECRDRLDLRGNEGIVLALESG